MLVDVGNQFANRVLSYVPPDRFEELKIVMQIVAKIKPLVNFENIKQSKINIHHEQNRRQHFPRVVQMVRVRLGVLGAGQTLTTVDEPGKVLRPAGIRQVKFVLPRVHVAVRRVEAKVKRPILLRF